jgi:hypothetical protein
MSKTDTQISLFDSRPKTPAPPATVPESATPLTFEELVAMLTAIKSIYERNHGRLPDGYVIHYREPVSFKACGHHYNGVRELPIRGFFLKGNLPDLYVILRRGSHTGYLLPFLRWVTHVTCRADERKDEFSGYEQFAKRFDRRFITETEIERLWNRPSAQHGGRYRPSDFKPIRGKGQRVMRRFLEQFCGLDGSGSGYNSDGYLTVWDNSSHERLGRDIKVSHLKGHPYVWWSSEYPRCGNGQYYLVAAENQVLHLEND